MPLRKNPENSGDGVRGLVRSLDFASALRSSIEARRRQVRARPGFTADGTRPGRPWPPESGVGNAYGFSRHGIRPCRRPYERENFVASIKGIGRAGVRGQPWHGSCDVTRVMRKGGWRSGELSPDGAARETERYGVADTIDSRVDHRRAGRLDEIGADDSRDNLVVSNGREAPGNDAARRLLPLQRRRCY